MRIHEQRDTILIMTQTCMGDSMDNLDRWVALCNGQPADVMHWRDSSVSKFCLRLGLTIARLLHKLTISVRLLLILCWSTASITSDRHKICTPPPRQSRHRDIPRELAVNLPCKIFSLFLAFIMRSRLTILLKAHESTRASLRTSSGTGTPKLPLCDWMLCRYRQNLGHAVFAHYSLLCMWIPGYVAILLYMQC